MTLKQQPITQAMVLDAISRAALTLDRADTTQAGLQQLLNDFRKTLLMTNGENATTVLYQSRITSYLLQHPTTYPATVADLANMLTQFTHQAS
ncbi:hypothetical protein [Lactiplantibacillus fabifermentans]|uniref:Bacteriocin immunity protein n=2 Tax=Lactiplantibacillus fabifermentans TaxID=483011 RepID=A0A0R2NXZ2_9LACO|nr:hypothetical protein [Lactiplantibacillus fabifermentans]ETY73026.1 hypothetical protein LFAB_14620 [Lactiplantibacillus fabifermentans T30PCM01]KRO29056.1 hypothetical protein DY78_GL001464 [Lactiplantibacillus fabifermentans DSM 21115]